MKKPTKISKTGVIDLQLKGWDTYDAMGLDQKAELCIRVADVVTTEACDIRGLVFDAAQICLKNLEVRKMLTISYVSALSKKKTTKLNLDRYWCQECGRIVPKNGYTCQNCGSTDIDCQKS